MMSSFVENMKSAQVRTVNAVAPDVMVVVEIYKLWKSHRVKGTIFIAFQIWCWGLAIHHIQEFKSIVDGLLYFLH
jgi:hypothetical protein